MLAVCTRRLYSRGLSTTASPSASAPTLASGAAVRACVLAILSQHADLLHTLDDRAYTFASPLLQASVAQHTRHSLDHLRKPVEAVLVHGASVAALVRYDVRQRNTDVEHDRTAALAVIGHLQDHVRALGTFYVLRSTFASSLFRSFALFLKGGGSLCVMWLQTTQRLNGRCSQRSCWRPMGAKSHSRPH